MIAYKTSTEPCQAGDAEHSPYRLFAVVNPHAANNSTGREWPRMLKRLEEKLGRVEHAFTHKSGDAVLLTRQALARGYNLILAVGGDGTNNEVVNGFFRDGQAINPEAVFSFLCRGTGGDFRKSFGWSVDLEECLSRLIGPERAAIDLGRLTFRDHRDNKVFRYFINIASFGIGGLVDEYCNASSKALGGKASFLIATVKAMIKFRNQRLFLSVDEAAPRELRAANIAVANGRFFGGGMMIAPRARVDDGLFDIVILGDLSKRAFAGLSRKIYRGEHLGVAGVEFLQGKKVTALSDERVLLDVDGEQPGKLPADFEILPQALYLKVGPEGLQHI